MAAPLKCQHNMNALTLDSKDPAVMEAIKDCAVGDEKDLLLKVKVTEVGPTVSMDVLSAKYAEPEEIEEESDVDGVEPGMDDAEERDTEMPKKKMKKGNPALAILIAPGGKR